MARKKHKTYAALDFRLLVSFTCGKCKEKHIVETRDIYRISGCRCNGGYRCYCPAPETRVEFKCPRCDLTYDRLAE